ncbi:hypothetical protein [Sporosarcina aquimarina]|uniref:Uncharacterized protein n=1 Tax=Sporosarcina aquimarina TaxID=114975 RepID=A0ABU4G0E4_9BACL|nr:hypothetical protein [Sporosarcina aquimarina]MDW0110439.1 hypothetical protein [Sporosarcina aquimarina]
MDIITGIFVVIAIIVILLMKESNKKVFVYIAFGIMGVARLSSGAEGIDDDLAVLLISSIIIIALLTQIPKIVNNIKDKKDFNVIVERIEEDHKKRQVEMKVAKPEVDEEYNRSLNYLTDEYKKKLQHIQHLLDKNIITTDNYKARVKEFKKQWIIEIDKLHSEKDKRKSNATKI